MGFANVVRLLAIFVVLVGGLALSGTASAQVAVEFSVGFAPPELPVYEQPICPGEGYMWTPGYWAWDDDDQDYYWVPGTWVEAPQVGYLWTPGYWGWGGEAYVFHVGYWGPVVGFYGGIDYGWGYTGRGYYGGRWDHDHFYYNREVNRIDERQVRNVYNERVENHYNVTRVSYNGPNGVNARPTPQEEAAARERHIGPVATQNQHIQAARGNPELRASANRGKPPIAATARPAAFSGGGVVPAKAGGNYNPPANRGGNNANRGGNAANRPTNESRPANENRSVNENNRPADNRASNNPNRPPSANNRPEANSSRPTYSHSTDLPKHSAPQAEGNSNQKYQQQQEKLAQKQNQEHAKLQQRQEQEHQRVTQQNAPPQRQQQMEQHHQQQTQQLEQKHEQQQQKVQQRAEPKQQAPPRQQSPEKKPPH
jgi:WXXGXW repeat (2 copies)